MKFFIIKKKMFFVFFIYGVLVVTFCATFFSISTVAVPKTTHTIVIDAGHGGIDGGAEGDLTGVLESELNLKYAKTLGKICKEFGFRVVFTRENSAGLYDESEQNKKKSEMQKREKIIRQAKPDLVVSLHMNSFPGDARGAHVFYAKGSSSGEALAKSVSKVLSEKVEYSHKEAKVGDYYILNCSSCPSILVECGFLSNAEEEILLQKEEYVFDFCYNVFCGIYVYFR